MNEKKYSAAEIAAMHLPGLPATKANVLARAEKEKWFYETKVGLGGVRKMFTIPRAYLPGYKPYEDEAPPVVAESKATNAKTAVVATIAAGVKVDPAVLEQVIKALDSFLLDRGMEMPPDRRAALIAVLYDYIVKGANSEDLTRLLKVMS